MSFSVVKLVIALLIAFVLGVSAGWLLRDRRSPGRHRAAGWPDAGATGTARPPTLVDTPPADTPPPAAPDATPPGPAPTPPSTGRDDLKRIHGVGPALERTLNGLGVRRFEQIAAWTGADIARVDDHLRFRGRIERDDWVGQARRLLAQPGR